MASPRSLVSQLYQHWAIIEQLCRQTREMPAFEPRQLLAVIRHFDTDGDAPKVLRQLQQNDILQPLGRSDALQVNPLVTDFVRGLTHEHELGLSEVLKARVDAIRDATELVSTGTDENSLDKLNRGANRLAELFRQIQQQLEQDLHAILEIAETAKSRNENIPLEKRYAAVLDAYDNYVEPINMMMDSGLGGSFYPYLERATQALERASNRLAVQGTLYTQRLRLRQTTQQAKELRRRGHQLAIQCADTLLPLREAVRQHNRITRVINGLLGKVRKQGLARALKSQKTPVPGWRRVRANRLQLHDEIRAIMAEARDFEPQPQPFPEAAKPEDMAQIGWVDEVTLKQTLKADLPVANLMEWLAGHYPYLPDAVILRLYHELVREPDWQATLATDETHINLQLIRVYYHGHTLSAPESRD